MDLVIATIQRTTILNVSGDTVNGGRRQRPDWERSVAQRIQEVTVRLSESRTEGGRYRGEVRLLAHRDTRLPSLEAIDIGRLDCALRVMPTWLTPVFNIDAEHHIFRRLIARALAAINFRFDSRDTRE